MTFLEPKKGQWKSLVVATAKANQSGHQEKFLITAGYVGKKVQMHSMARGDDSRLVPGANVFVTPLQKELVVLAPGQDTADSNKTTLAVVTFSRVLACACVRAV